MNRGAVTFLGLLCALWGGHRCEAGLVIVEATGPNRNIEPLQEIVMQVDQGSGYVTETMTGSRTFNRDADSILLSSISTTSGLVLNGFSTITPTISNSNFPSSGNNIEVFTPRTAVKVANANFLNELAGVHSTGDLMQYLRVDGFNGADPMWDFNYGGASFDSNNYLIVEERDGNTTFLVEPLDVNGNTIAGSDTLSFRDGSYEWDVGYHNSLDPNNATQTQELSVLSFDLFNTSTPIGGFRVTNTGNADFKFFIGTSSTPEPSAFILLVIGALPGLRHRRCRSNDA